MKYKNLKFYFKVFFSFLLIGYLITQIDYDQISFIRLSFIPSLIFGITIALLSFFIMALRWTKMIKSHLEFNIKTAILFQYYLIGSFFNIFMPGSIGGDVVRTQRLVTRHKVPAGKATIITIAERISGMYALVLLLSFSFLFLNYPPAFGIERYLPVWLIRLSPVIVILCVPLVKWLLQKKRFTTTYNYIGKIVGLSALAQIGDIIIAWLFSHYFGLEIHFSAFLFLMPLVYIATVLPISLGGLGVREGAFSGLMVLYGADAGVAVIISLLMYLVKVAVGIIGYGVYVRK